MKKLYFILIAFLVLGGVEAQIVNIPDANFKNALLHPSWASSETPVINQTSSYVYTWTVSNYNSIDTNNDGEIQVSEAQAIKYLYLENLNITSLIGIEAFTNLKFLDCSNNQLTSLNVSSLTNLECLSMNHNQIDSINLSNLTDLESLSCSYNQITVLNLTNLMNLLFISIQYNTNLTSLDVSVHTNLKRVDAIFNNQLTSLNVSGCINLSFLNCYNNNITSLDVSNLNNLLALDCSYNSSITNLNVSNCTNLYTLFCDENLINHLDVSDCISLLNFDCSYNSNLTYLLIKNGVSLTQNSGYYFSDCPNLRYICVENANIAAIQYQLNLDGMTNCQINSYCSFVPGGTFYTIQGNNRYDEDNNGCSSTDINYPNLKLTFTDGINIGNLIPDTSGTYRFDVQAGTQTFNPTLENPTYFNISPTTATVTFPTTTSPYIQDFCITANGVHNDLEVAILPIGNARPGFDAHYQIIYKNKGTATQSGTIALTYNGTISSFVSAIPAVSSQATNNLSWSFTDLQPFETRTIEVTLNINTPTATPPVNTGDILNYTATITGLTDETPSDNVTTLNQTALNSYDPNDKTCIEGTTVSPSMVGQYVHYIIHFENDGTANAQNIVVKDMIDTTKYDITSLVPITGSAPFTTRITNTNRVEFIFQNINLPYTTGSNDGYVAFKIKTKPTLVVGDTFSNTANIYFDYNAPIVTNTATTTIAALANPTFAFSDYFTLSPIPTKGTLNITTKQDIIISSISIYNTLGQVMLVTSNPSKTIDVSNLTTGSYFIKVITDKGTSSGKFIKE